MKNVLAELIGKFHILFFIPLSALVLSACGGDEDDEYYEYDNYVQDESVYDVPYYDPAAGMPKGVYNQAAHPDYDPNGLIWSSHGGNALWDFCYYKPDNTPLPVDPRSLVNRYMNEGKAVHFNTDWRECHILPEVLAQERGFAKTCGEYREMFDRGERLLNTGKKGVGALFTGNYPFTIEGAFGISTFPAVQYNKVWKIWGLS